ncbi:molecular chaperone TorD family protein [Arabiibacter massiliensis]|uniref:molecular chaperone TorD family protein n=1 Tax=Arabiibacter massiliensis TaxID=1870985 RepID=UPI001E61CE80|nr:molecular chaperone TorD family protein [Arabiibacter massiliensis]
MLQNAAWQHVREAAGVPGSEQHEALALPSWEERSTFQNELLMSGMPFAAMPVESLYKPWSALAGNAYGATRGLYLGDSAQHMKDVYQALAIEVPAAFASMPDHLTLELELLAMFLMAGNEAAARDVARDHFDWLGEYDAALVDRAERIARCEDMAPDRQAALERGAAFLRALVALAGRLVADVAATATDAHKTRVAV